MMQDIDEAQATLYRLKELGADIAIDDFGTGFSTFFHLDLLPIDVVKIDRSFVMNLGTAGRLGTSPPH